MNSSQPTSLLQEHTDCMSAPKMTKGAGVTRTVNRCSCGPLQTSRFKQQTLKLWPLNSSGIPIPEKATACLWQCCLAMWLRLMKSSVPQPWTSERTASTSAHAMIKAAGAILTATKCSLLSRLSQNQSPCRNQSLWPPSTSGTLIRAKEMVLRFQLLQVRSARLMNSSQPTNCRRVHTACTSVHAMTKAGGVTPTASKS